MSAEYIGHKVLASIKKNKKQKAEVVELSKFLRDFKETDWSNVPKAMLQEIKKISEFCKINIQKDPAFLSGVRFEIEAIVDHSYGGCHTLSSYDCEIKNDF